MTKDSKFYGLDSPALLWGLTLANAFVFYIAYWENYLIWIIYLLYYLATSIIIVLSLIKIANKNFLWWLALVVNIYLVLAQLVLNVFIALLAGPEYLFEVMRGNLLK